MKKLIPLLLLTGLVANLAPTATAAEPAEKAAKSAELPNLAKIFDNKLVDSKGKRVKAESLAKAKYVAVYFSAHWCPPCRAFTPKLVKFVEENQKNGNFEVVFVSSDRSEKDMLGYMTENQMPWGAMLRKGAQLKSVDDGITGIPHLRLFDATGKVVSDTVVDGKYVGPTHVLKELSKLIK